MKLSFIEVNKQSICPVSGNILPKGKIQTWADNQDKVFEHLNPAGVFKVGVKWCIKFVLFLPSRVNLLFCK